jgi:oligopeptidase A
MHNPLLSPDAPLPNFDAISAEHFLPAITTLVEQSESALTTLLEDLQASATPPSWQSLLHPLEEIADQLDSAWSAISHLNGVCKTEEIRQAYSDCLPVLTDYSTRMGQNKPLFNACKQLRDSDAYTNLDTAQRKSLDNKIRDFKLAGVDLSEAEQQRFAEIKTRMAELTTQFSNNVLDATQGWHKQTDNAKDLAGLPESSLAAAKLLAEQKSLSGYVVTLDIPSYLPVMQYCHNRQLREELYKAYVTRASDQGDSYWGGRWDNSAIMEEILQLRQSLAQLLGFANYADYSIATKMASSVDEVFSLLDELSKASVDIAKKEYAELAAFAAESLDIETLEAWDINYATEALRLARYDLSQEELRPYFPADKVIQGMFEVVQRLYGIDIKVLDAPSQWHSDVRFYQLSRNGEVIAQCYLDLFARDAKRGGAWMADCRVRRQTVAGDIQLPVAFLTCNFSPPAEDKPSLLTHNEVTTLFHEFGHGLHHMLTQINCAEVSGINGVAWDAVELPSQFMENWCWEPEALALFSSHYVSGEALPIDLLDKMLAARNFQSALQMVRQLEFASFDLLIHRDYAAEGWQGIQATLDQVRDQLSAYPVPSFNRFQHGFGHIFAGGYAAGYYSYKWAEVLSSDAFSLFEENGVFDQASGALFLNAILERGGSQEPAELFKRFRGRAPSTEALLRHSGITAAA